jgi:hypothetical protein
MGIYNQTLRSGSLVADSPSRLYHLTAQSLSHLEKEAPELATQLHKFIIQVLSERLIDVKHNPSTLSPRSIAPHDTAPYDTASHGIDQPVNQHTVPTILSSNDRQAIAELSMLGKLETSFIASAGNLDTTDISLLDSIDRDFVEATRRELVYCVGPVGSKIVSKVVAEYGACSPQEWIEAIASNVSDASKASRLRQRLSAILHKSVANSLAGRLSRAKEEILSAQSQPSDNLTDDLCSSTSSSFFPSSPQQNNLSPDFIEHCRTELAYHIGPMASFLLEEALEKYPSATPQQLVEAIALKIPDSQKAYKFQMLTLMVDHQARQG